MKVYIQGASTTKFGELWHKGPRELVREAVSDTLSQAATALSRVQAIFVGNMLSGSLAGQEHLGAFFAEELGLSVPAVKIEGACASGGLAVHAGFLAVASGYYDNVLVIGVEKMTDYKPEEIARALMGAGADEEREAGATFPALYALLARVHMKEFGTTEEDMAYVSVKNHYHASLNSHAQFTFPVSLEQVLRSPVISSPLKLLDCSPVSDGAAAVLLSSKPATVEITASRVATDSLGLFKRKKLTSLQAAVDASKKAYEMGGVEPKDIDVAEVHDCFTIAEIMAVEDLGFAKKGEGAAMIRRGATRLGGEGPIVNTSGGLKACGHPVGATGVKQVVEIFHQLNGTAEKKQVKKARIGLTHNVGGSGATAVIHILKSRK